MIVTYRNNKASKLLMLNINKPTKFILSNYKYFLRLKSTSFKILYRLNIKKISLS